MTGQSDRRYGERCFVFRTLFAVSLLTMAAMPAVAADAAAKMKLGREVFTSVAAPPCGLCHTLKDAGTTGEIGAKLEELKPDAGRVAEAVRKGLGVMPPYDGKLTEAQIEAVAHYVSQAARAAN